MAFKGRYINVTDLVDHAKKNGPITAADALKLLDDQPSTRFVLVDGEPDGKASVIINGTVMTVK